MVRLLRFLRGYVVFAVTGSYPEKFVNLCIYNGLNIWGVQSKEGTVYCRTLASNYSTIRRLSRSRSVKVRIKSKAGIPFILRKNRDRVGIPIGIVCFLIIFKLLSLFVWNIDIYGFDTISYTAAKDVLQRVGVYEGALNSYDSLKNIETKAMIEFGNVSWITVNIDGSRGDVKISEVIEEGEILDDSKPCNIKAETDGQIIRVDAYSGMSMVKSGDAVVKGNLLISGIVETELGGTHLEHSSGIVWAKTSRLEKITIPKLLNAVNCCGEEKDRYSLKLFNLVIPLSMRNLPDNGDCLSYIDETKACFRGERASVSLIKESIFPYERHTIEVDGNKAEKLFKTEMLLKELFSYNDKKIISRSIESSADNSNYIYSVNYECEEDIGEKSDILIDGDFKINNSAETDTDTNNTD